MNNNIQHFEYFIFIYENSWNKINVFVGTFILGVISHHTKCGWHTGPGALLFDPSEFK